MGMGGVIYWNMGILTSYTTEENGIPTLRHHPPTHKKSPFTVSSLWALLDGMVMGSVLCR